MTPPAATPASEVDSRAERWSPEDLSPEAVESAVGGASNPRDRLLLRTLWATRARLGAVLALRPRDIRRGAVLLPDVKRPHAPGELVQVVGAHARLPTELRRWAREQGLADDEPLFFSRERDANGRRKPIDRVRAWQIVTAATRRAADGQSLAGGRPQRALTDDQPAVQSLSEPVEPTRTHQVRLTNVGPPLVRAHLVPRKRVVERLNDALQHAVTLVAAPAGFGKTTALVTWANQVGDRLLVSWLSLGISDNDPVRFWRGVLAALQTREPGLGASALARLLAGAPIASVVDDLLGDLAELAVPIALVIDDYHVIQTPEIHASLAAIVRQRAGAFHLIISTRADPPLPVARLRSIGQLLELRAADLQFTEDEAAGLIGDALGVELSTEQIAALDARTEGWAAGLHLAALSLRAQADLPTALAAFAGSDRSIVDYFAEEILDHLPEDARVFLERSSILDRLSPALCDAVVGQTGSAAVLDVLERGNVFVTPVDQGRQWFRYHQLFADTLRHRLERDEPMLVPSLHERASAWYEGHELLEDAVEHALIARQWDRAGRLIHMQLGMLMWRGEEMTVRRWLQGVPDEVRHRDPVLARATATTLLMTGEGARLEAFLAVAEPELEAAGEHEALGVLLSNHAQVAVYLDDLEGAQACAERALELLPDQPGPYRAQAFGAIVQCYLLRGTPDSARDAFEQVEAVITRGMRLVYWTHQLNRAEWSRQLGDLARAAAGYRALLDDTGERAVFARHKAYLGLSAIELEWDRLDEATDNLDRSEEGQRVSGRTYRTIRAAALLQRARILRARGELLVADEMLNQAESAAREQGSARSERLARAERAWVALQDGRAGDAERWAEELDLAGLETYAREPEVLVLARVRRAQGAGGELRPLFEQLVAAAEQAGRTDSAIGLLVQLALIRGQGGDAAGAHAALERAVSLAEPARYVRVFLDDGEQVAVLLRQLLRRGGCPPYTSRLLRAFAKVGERAPTLPDLLTPREREVLSLLGRGLPNRAIADQLVTSQATIKSHVHRLIDKLGVTGRAEVVVRARELGELDRFSHPVGGD